MEAAFAIPTPSKFMLGSRAQAYESAFIRIVGKDCDIAVSAGLPHLKWNYVHLRTNRYLNNLIEQDHRAIKRRYASMGGFKSFQSATITLAGIELAHRIRKRQFALGRVDIGTSDR
jgi:transposase-like protein